MFNNLKKYKCIVIVILLTLSVFANKTIFAKSGPKILILNSYHHGYKWTDDITNGIRNKISEQIPNAKFYIEYMDTKHYYGSGFFKKLQCIYKFKYNHIDFDLIISSDDNAYSFLKKYHYKLFNKVPVVFCGVNFYEDRTFKNKEYFTGVNEDADVESNIELVLKLHGKIDKIVIIHDTTVTGIKISKRIKEIVPKYSKIIKFEYIYNESLNDLYSKVKKLSDNDVIIFITYFKDKNNNFYEYNEVISELSQITKIPIYGMWDFVLNSGIIGGKLTSAYYQGDTAATLALRILNGEKVNDIKIVTDSPNKYMFDNNLLVQHEIPKSKLPENSIVINEESNIYNFIFHYKYYLLTIIIICLSPILILLSINIKNQQKIKNQILTSEKKYKSIFENTGTATIILDKDTNIILANSEFEKLSGYNKTEVENKKSIKEFIYKDDVNDLIFNHYLRLSNEEEAAKNFEYKFVDRYNNLIYIFMSIDLINGSDNSIVAILDITDKKKTINLLETTIYEKETLLKEIHHRVKNNFQMVESLISLQLSKNKDGKLTNIYENIKRRIRVMSLIHEKLYKSKDIKYINFAEYIKEISSNLYENYKINPEKIILKTNLKNVFLNVESAIPCGLIVNELLTNVFTHAFSKSTKKIGEVNIQLLEENSNVELILSDNGVGLPDEIDLQKIDTLGLQLVNILSKQQLKGSVDLVRDEGTKFIIKFKYKKKK